MSTSALSPVLVLLAALPLTACTSTYDVRLSELSSIERGASVQLTDGDRAEIRDTFSVRAAPFAGAAFVPTRQDPLVLRAEPMYDAAGRSPPPWEATPWLDGPVKLRLADQALILEDARLRVFVDATSVRALQVRQSSPGKTAALVIGLAIPGALLTWIQVALAVAAMSGR